MSIQQKKVISSAGNYRGQYKPKEENIKKLKVYLNKINNES